MTRSTTFVVLIAVLELAAVPAHGQLSLKFPNGTTNNGPSVALLTGNTSSALMHVQNDGANGRALQFVESGCTGETYGVWGLTYSAAGIGGIGVAALDNS